MLMKFVNSHKNRSLTLCTCVQGELEKNYSCRCGRLPQSYHDFQASIPEVFFRIPNIFSDCHCGRLQQGAQHSYRLRQHDPRFTKFLSGFTIIPTFPSILLEQPPKDSSRVTSILFCCERLLRSILWYRRKGYFARVCWKGIRHGTPVYCFKFSRGLDLALGSSSWACLPEANIAKVVHI